MKTVACYSIKGGVGKTAASVNFAYCSARSGIRTLLIDLDPQGASSFYFRHQSPQELTSKRLLKGKKLLKYVTETQYPNLDLLPAHRSYRELELRLDAADNAPDQLTQILSPLAEHYDLLILDCPQD